MGRLLKLSGLSFSNSRPGRRVCRPRSPLRAVSVTEASKGAIPSDCPVCRAGGDTSFLLVLCVLSSAYGMDLRIN